MFVELLKCLEPPLAPPLARPATRPEGLDKCPGFLAETNWKLIVSGGKKDPIEVPRPASRSSWQMMTRLPTGRTLSDHAFAGKDFSGVRKQILSVLTKSPTPLSGGQISVELNLTRYGFDGNVHARLTELKKRGLIVADHTGICPITGEQVQFHRLRQPDDPPLEQEPKPTRAQLLAQIAELEHQVADYQHLAEQAIRIAERIAGEARNGQ
jgi:hypothetical protein